MPNPNGRPKGALNKYSKEEKELMAVTKEAAIAKARQVGDHLVDELYDLIRDEQDSETFEDEALRFALDRAMDLSEESIMLAKESEHPRTFEVAGNVVKEVANIAKEIKMLDKKSKNDRIDRLQKLADTVLKYAKETGPSTAVQVNSGKEVTEINFITSDK